MKLFLSLVMFYSCANGPIKNIEAPPIKREEVKIEFEKISIDVKNGKSKYIEFTTPQADGSYTLSCTEVGSPKPLKQNIPYYVKNHKAMTYYAESYFSSAKAHQCYFEDQVIVDINVSRFPYKEERLNVDKRKIDLSKKDLQRVIRERKLTAELYKNSLPYLLFDSPFEVPLNSYITSYYGNQRIFNNKKRSQHLGNDFRAKVGVKIPASNKGKVIFVGNLFYTGNVVILDHGLNIFSLYAHLSKILVTEGSILNRGDIVGLSGKTGRVSGPHLHWGIKIHGHNTDGFSLVEESIKQFEADEAKL